MQSPNSILIPPYDSRARLEALRKAARSGTWLCSRGYDGGICCNGICLTGMCPNWFQGPHPSL